MKNINMLTILLLLFLTRMTMTATGQEADSNIVIDTSSSVSSKAELNLWKDPAFQKAFTESYIAETEIEPRVTEDERDQMLKVMGLLSSDEEGGLDKAAALLKKEMDRNEAVSAVFDFTLANIYFQQDKLEEAAKYYQNAVEKYPKFRRARKNLGLIYVRQQEFAKALPTLTKVVELGGGDAVTYGLLGFAYSSVENDLSAESAYRMAILLDPETLDWKMGLARSFFKQERFSEAVSMCDQLIRKYPERADLWLLQANAYIGLNQPLKAAEIYEIVNRLGQSTVDSLNILGDIYINQELYSMAADNYISAMQKDPQYDLNRAVRSAKVLIARGAFEETQRLLEYVESHFKDRLDTETHKSLLKLRARLAVAEGSGDEEEARVLNEIVKLDPQDGEALILLGQHSARTGDTEKAVFYYERAAAIEAFEADAKVRHAQLLVSDGKYDEAIPLLKRAQLLKPRDNIQEYLEQVERISKNR